MLQQVVEYLKLKPGEVFCDCTLGGAGHSIVLGRHLGNDGLLIGIDQDPEALAAASEQLEKELPDLPKQIIHGNFAELDDLLLELQIPGVDKFLFDLGVSSHQLDSSHRGFSYSQDAPINMKMDPGQPNPTAQEVINSLNVADLTRTIATYGEERYANRIAKAIVEQRQIKPLETTAELVEVIYRAVPAAARRTGGNPAKRTFQALRIFVNSELDALEAGLDAALRWLNPGGRVAVMSYHSLEDRIVKQRFVKAAEGCICPPETVICACGRKSVFELVTRKPVLPDAEEVEENPRSASAKLRVLARKVSAVDRLDESL